MTDRKRGGGGRGGGGEVKTEIQKFEYRENEKSSLDAIKSFFHNYYIRAAI